MLHIPSLQLIAAMKEDAILEPRSKRSYWLRIFLLLLVGLRAVFSADSLS